MPDKLNPQGPEGESVINPEADEFFQRLPSNLRWPKPSPDALAAATEAILRMSGKIESFEGAAPASEPVAEPTSACAGCGGAMPAGARFCVWCGSPKDVAGGPTPPASASSQHHFHHHYHHLVPAAGSAATTTAGSEPSTPRGRAPGAAGPAPGGRAELAARQLVQDWAQACNTRHIDDLLELYSADATLIRSSVPPVRSLAAIREFLLSMLEAGLGDVEMESLRLEIMGDVAFDLGRCKMLVPTAMGKRREERGKYLVVLVRQPTGTWKILADCWSSDSPLTTPATPDIQKGK